MSKRSEKQPNSGIRKQNNAPPLNVPAYSNLNCQQFVPNLIVHPPQMINYPWPPNISGSPIITHHHYPQQQQLNRKVNIQTYAHTFKMYGIIFLI